MEDETAKADDRQDEGIPLWAVELGCWTMVVLAPFLYWVNGPAVSTDQAVVRSLVVGLAWVGGITIRMVRWRHGKAKRLTQQQSVCDEKSRGGEKQVDVAPRVDDAPAGYTHQEG